MKLYKSMDHPNHWIAYAPGEGWIAFPKSAGGWDTRHPARGLDPLAIREVPLHLAHTAGLPVPDAELVLA